MVTYMRLTAKKLNKLVLLAASAGLLCFQPLFAGEQEWKKVPVMDAKTAERVRANMAMLAREKEKLRHPKIEFRLAELLHVFEKEGKKAGQEYAREKGIYLKDNQTIEIAITVSYSDKVDSLITALTNSYNVKFASNYNVLNGYIPINFIRGVADNNPEINHIEIHQTRNPLVAPETELSYLPRFCSTNDDCANMFESCGDLTCSAQKISCQNGICCGTKFENGGKDIKFAADDDYEHLSACSNRVAKYRELEYCEIFPDALRMTCRNRIFAEDAYDYGKPALCTNISSDTILKDDCYSMVAKKLLKPALCKKVQSPQKRDECFSFVYATQAYKTNEPSLCFKVPIETSSDPFFHYTRIECFSQAAATTGDRALCENLPASHRENCNVGAAIKAMDYEYCLSTKNDRCLWFIAAGNAPVDLENNCKRLSKKAFDKQKCIEKLLHICELTSELNKERCREEVARTFRNYDEYVVRNHE